MRLIDADALKGRFIHGRFDDVYISEKEVQDAPTVDAVAVVHGNWIFYGGFSVDGDYYAGKYECSECGHYIIAGSDRNYCPNCGAKMDGERKTMRLIDADAAVKKLQEECEECMLTKEQRETYCSGCGVTEAMNVLWEAPAVDAAPVVFCRDCEHWGSKKTVGGFAKCSLEGAWHGPEFYCGNGVKRA